jgi:hypothetical protein
VNQTIIIEIPTDLKAGLRLFFLTEQLIVGPKSVSNKMDSTYLNVVALEEMNSFTFTCFSKTIVLIWKNGPIVFMVARDIADFPTTKDSPKFSRAICFCMDVASCDNNISGASVFVEMLPVALEMHICDW